MSGLQTAFDIIGIVFMGLILILIAVLVAAIFVIRSKITKIEEKIERRVEEAADIAGRGGDILATVGKHVAKHYSRKIKKSVTGHR